MSKYYYDFHVHSCLSPCGDADNTPNNLAGMAFLNGVRIMALTDHNSSRNCPAFFEAARRYGIVPIAGMELTTSEDIHAVCLFETLEDALAFNDEVDTRRVRVKNRADIFGEQLILDTLTARQTEPLRFWVTSHTMWVSTWLNCTIAATRMPTCATITSRASACCSALTLITWTSSAKERTTTGLRLTTAFVARS